MERFSQSSIWKQQRETYERLGVESWAASRVPFHMTNNSRIAAGYADIACEIFRNCPFTILELGGGCGKFAFLLIGELLRRNVSVQYLLTDGAKKNRAFWERHPCFKDWIDQKILQLAVLDPIVDPIPCSDLVLANYFFDSIPQDIFHVENGVLYEGLMKERPVEKAYYPELPIANAILEEYRQSFPSGSFLFPIGALKVISRLPQTCVLIAADRGICKKEAAQTMPLRSSDHGGAFSFAVNFHAIRLFTELQQGAIDFFKTSHPDFHVSLISKYPQNCLNFQTFGPLNTEAKNFSSILTRLHEAHWDATLFFSFFKRIQEMYAQALENEKKEMMDHAKQILERFFPLFREDAILLQQLGLFLEEKDGACEEAALRFQNLPSEIYWMEPFIRSPLPLGDVLQIGERGNAPEAIASTNPKSFRLIPWNSAINGQFDTIFLFPPKVQIERKKPEFVKNIEKQLLLDKMRYADEDIRAFAARCNVSKAAMSQFLKELESNKNITKEQLVNLQKELGLEVIYEGERFFDVLKICLRQHIRPGAVLRAHLLGIETYDHSGFDEEIVADPYFDVVETADSRGVWLSVRRLFKEIPNTS
ncbi:MAG TPA: hypothetical protein VLE95_04995 [Chlamydiales bacterium]|nr:hypothetical protein [Chlamydiales bacterium]